MNNRRLPQVTVFPKSKWGRWSGVFALAFILVFSIIVWLTLSQAFTGALSGLDPAVLAQVLKIFLAAIAASTLITGVAGMIKNQERSIATFVSIAIGFFGLIGSLR